MVVVDPLYTSFISSFICMSICQLHIFFSKLSLALFLFLSSLWFSFPLSMSIYIYMYISFPYLPFHILVILSTALLSLSSVYYSTTVYLSVQLYHLFSLVSTFFFCTVHSFCFLYRLFCSCTLYLPPPIFFYKLISLVHSFSLICTHF